MESPNNGTDRNINELQPTINLSSDSITPERKDPLLFTSDELLVKAGINSDFRQLSPSPLTIDLATTEALWADIATPSTTTGDGELINLLLPPSRPQLRLVTAPTIEYEIVTQGRDLALSQSKDSGGKS